MRAEAGEKVSGNYKVGLRCPRYGQGKGGRGLTARFADCITKSWPPTGRR